MSTRLYSRVGQVDISKDGEDFLTQVTEEVLCNFSKELHYIIEKASKYEDSNPYKKVKSEVSSKIVSEQSGDCVDGNEDISPRVCDHNTNNVGEGMVTRSRGEAT